MQKTASGSINSTSQWQLEHEWKSFNTTIKYQKRKFRVTAHDNFAFNLNKNA